MLLQEDVGEDDVMLAKRSTLSGNQLGIVVAVLLLILLFYIQYFTSNRQYVYNYTNILIV